MYYHRAYVLRKNMLDPKLGRMQWPTQSEGRWRSPWYPNVISYGAAHQVREARWLRDPKYWQGHLRTWAENEKADGVYPSHVTPKGPSDGQYTDWITSTAWDGHLVHPDRRVPGPGRGQAGRQRPRLAEGLRPRRRRPAPGRLALVDRHGVPAVVLLLLGLQDLEGLRPARAAGEPRAGRSDGLQLRQRRRRGADLPLAGPAREGQGVRRPRRQDRRGRGGQDVAAREAVLLLAPGRR